MSEITLNSLDANAAALDIIACKRAIEFHTNKIDYYRRKIAYEQTAINAAKAIIEQKTRRGEGK